MDKLPERVKLEDGKITLHKKRYSKSSERPERAGRINPVWHATIKLGRGVQRRIISTGEKDIRRAERVARDKAFELEALAHQGLSITPDRFDDITRRFLTQYKQLMLSQDRIETFKHRKQIIDNIWIPRFGNKNINQITSQLIYKEHLNLVNTDTSKTYVSSNGKKHTVKTGGKLAASTISKYLIVLREIFNHALKEGKINQIPQFPKVSNKKSFTPRPALTEQEWKNLNSVLRDFDDDIPEGKAIQRYYRRSLRDWCQVIAYSGLRTGEASKLKWKDWEIKKDGTREYCLLNVRGEEKGARKTGNRKVVGIGWLNHTLARRKEDSKFSNPEDYIFQHSTGKPIISFRKSFDKALKKAGIGHDDTGTKLRGYSPYILRHTMATFALSLRNVDIYQVALNLGNSTTVVEKFYSKAKPEDFAAQLGDISKFEDKGWLEQLLHRIDGN